MPALDPKQDRSHKDFEAPQEEQDAVKGWSDRVAMAEKRFETFFTQLSVLRGYTYGIHKDRTDAALVRTNMTFATIAGMIPHLYARNPEIAVTLNAGVPEGQMQMVKKFSKTAETFLAQVFVREGKLKKRAKSNLRSTMTTSFGVLKLLMQERLAGDPVVVRRVQDAQDNLSKVEALRRALKKDEDPTLLNQKRDELKANVIGLQAGNELRYYKGFAVDRIRTEDMLVMDPSIEEFDEYVDSNALGHKIWMTVDRYTSTFGHTPESATRYNAPYRIEEQAKAQTTDPTPAVPPGATAPAPGEMYVCVCEIWDKENQVIRTITKGMKRWTREPYAPPVTGQRWYPFYFLGFNLVEGRFRPLSDVELLMGLQDEYNTTRTNYADVRKKSVPLRVFRLGGSLDDDDIKKMVHSQNEDWVGVKGNPARPITDDVMQLEGLKIDPNAYDVTIIRNDMDLVSGATDASRANLIKPKTATEAELMAQSMSTRVDERRDANEDMMSEMAEDALEQGLRRFTPAEIKKICGADAEWPEGASVDEIFSLVNVSVRAGSSGRPNSQKEKDQWTALLPVISEAMKQVSESRVSGNFDMANAQVELLRETLRRFEERLDIDSIIPPLQKGEDGKPVMQAQQMMQMQQQQQQLTEKLEELQQALEQCQEQLQKAQAAEQAKIVEAQAKAQLEAQRQAEKAAEQMAKVGAEQADAQREDMAEARRIEAEEAQQTRELESKERMARDAAMLKAAVDIITSEQATQSAERQANAAAGADGERVKQEGAAAADSEARVMEVVGKIDKTMASLTKTLATMQQASSERTELIKGMIDKPTQH